jgi:hypothetical protein
MAKWPPAVDPLKGWNCWGEYDEESHPAMYGYHGTILVQRAQPAKHSPLDQAIKDDYQNYIKTHERWPFPLGTTYYEDGTGQHAAKVQICNYDHEVLFYILIYDKSNTRTKVLKFFYCRNSC